MKYLKEDHPDPRMRWHVSTIRIATNYTCLIDHTGLSKSYGDGLDIDIMVPRAPDIDKKSWNLDRGRDFDQDFAGLINARASAAYAQAERHGYEYIYISYGGGVDSCTIGAAMLQHPQAQRWLDESRLIIKTTRFAQREDPIVWNRLVEMNVPLEYLDYDELTTKDTRNWMMVTGDVEPVWGSCYPSVTKDFLNEQDRYTAPWQRLEPYMLARDPSGLGWEYFQALMKTAPFEIKTCFQAWWWFEWCTNTQCYMFRIPSYSSAGVIDPRFVFPGTKLFWTLGYTDMWDHGAYVTANRLIPENPRFLKLHSLKYLADWMKWSSPRPKSKVHSQFIIPKYIHKMKIYNDLSWSKEGFE